MLAVNSVGKTTCSSQLYIDSVGNIDATSFVAPETLDRILRRFEFTLSCSVIEFDQICVKIAAQCLVLQDMFAFCKGSVYRDAISSDSCKNTAFTFAPNYSFFYFFVILCQLHSNLKYSCQLLFN